MKRQPTYDKLDQALVRRVVDHQVAGGADWASFASRRATVAMRGPRRWIGAAAAVVLCALVGGSGYLLGWYDQVERQALALTQTKLQLEEPIKELLLAAQVARPVLSQARVSLPTVADFSSSVLVAPTSETATAEPIADQAPEPTSKRATRSTSFYGPTAPTAHRQRAKSGLQLGAYAALGSSGAAGATPHTNGLQAAAAMNYRVGKYQGNHTFAPQDMQHDFPVTVGLSLDIPLVPRLRLSTGLLYTYIHSWATASMGAEYRYDRQTHYLGIPVSVSYDFLATRALSLYGTGGAVVEFAVASTQRSEVRATTGELLSHNSKPIDTQGVMTSFNLGIGVNVHLSPRVGLYAEPGVTTFLPNDTHPLNFRTSTPVQFSLRAGIRVKL